MLAAGQGSIMAQMKSLQTSVQTNALFENLSSKATMVRDASICRGASTCIPCRCYCTQPCASVSIDLTYVTEAMYATRSVNQLLRA